MSLVKYKQKRSFGKTPEPKAQKQTSKGKLKFVVQRHAATRLHYDFRLEMEGVLKSWAVPKGPSLNPKDKRLAMMVEDHPYNYRTFEGVIPQGNYGAGVVEIWDEGTYEHIEVPGRKGEQALLADLHQGSLKFILQGKKLRGEFALVKMKGGDDNAWLLIKHKDAFAVNTRFDAEKLTAADSKVTEAVHQKAKKKTTASRRVTEDEPVKKKPADKVQAEKKFTDYVHPMLAKPAEAAFDDDGWLFELKWDGYRAIAETGKKNVRLYSRNGLSFAAKYPLVYEALGTIKDEMILDGEIVAFNEDGRPDFQQLQMAAENPSLSLYYYVFDILSYKGKNLTQIPLVKRKTLLQKVLPENAVVLYCDDVPDKGIAFFDQVVARDMEGIIAKRKDSTYQKGKRTGDWLKIKHHNTEEVVIAGYTRPRGSRKHFGALVLGRYKGNVLHYAGHTGTGFDEASLKDLYKKLQPLITPHSPFNAEVKTNMPVTWVKPVLVGNIKFTEITREGIFRHPVFQGLRIDKKPIEVKTTPPSKKTAGKKKPADKAASATIIRSGGKELLLTNQQKIFWPAEGYTKGDVIAYYTTMYKYIIPYLKNRPESLNRTPNGITAKGFYQKDAGGQAPEWVPSIKLYSESAEKEIDYIICNDKLTLLYLNNLGCIELNPWNSRTSSLEYPDYMVIDLDPSAKNSFEEVIDAANATKEVLDKAGAKAFCKTSGSTGLHIYVPMAGKYNYAQVRDFCKVVVMQVQQMMPENTTLERSLSKRSDKKIYLDYLQNKQGQTLAAPYSLRPKPGATASAPLQWKEVKHGLHPSQFDIKTLPRRVEKMGDIFKPVLGRGADILKCLKKLGV